MTNYSTIFLDAVSWDIVADANGAIAVAGPPYSQAQDASSAIRTWLGELYYDTTRGVPYSKILGQIPNFSALKSYMTTAALTVPGVTSAVCFISSYSQRSVSGQVTITNESGQTATAAF